VSPELEGNAAGKRSRTKKVEFQELEVEEEEKT
jgi:hypothetical protein